MHELAAKIQSQVCKIEALQSVIESLQERLRKEQEILAEMRQRQRQPILRFLCESTEWITWVRE